MKIFKSQHLNDALAVILMIIIYNAWISIAYDTIQYLNWRKVLWGTIAGFFAFVPMFTILFLTLRVAKSKLLFFIVSILMWAIEPIFWAQFASDALTAQQGTSVIYDEGKLTAYGYLHGLQNPFLILALYAAATILHSFLQTIKERNKL